jgi:DNA mismatch endonuclease (patch repair protein)
MTDVFTKAKRSEVMSNIRGKGNKSTEIKLFKLFKKNGIKGWRRHQPLPGKPDFVFTEERLAVFVDGCFLHGCPRCYIKPKQNAKFWRDKIGGNKKRDQRVAQQLRRDGWSVCRIWECRLKNPDSVIRRINRML